VRDSAIAAVMVFTESGACYLGRSDPAVTAACQRGKQARPLRPPLMPALAEGGRRQADRR
jgi:hypothetical protein